MEEFVECISEKINVQIKNSIRIILAGGIEPTGV